MKHVYYFGAGGAEGNASMPQILGGKGANLAEMSRLGIPVPPGFTISADLCHEYLRTGVLSEELKSEVREHMNRLAGHTGRRFGDPDNPLLVSVRSGAKVSMPGMMDTILNLGLNDETAEGLARQAHDRRFAFDSYRRLVQMFGNVVCGVHGNGSNPFETVLTDAKQDAAVDRDIDLDEEALAEITRRFKTLIKVHGTGSFPNDPWDQLWGAIEAVFRSWGTKRARDYRRLNGISEDLGTAVNVMAMVFGNLGDDSGTGVAFTRNPATGEPGVFGEFLMNAQGEDVVAGVRTPEPLSAMEAFAPTAYREFLDACKMLEDHYRDMQDVEFTVEHGKLFILQTRSGKRTARASIRVAVDMVREGLIDEQEAVLRVEPDQLNQLLHPTVDPDSPQDVIVTGLPASPGAAIGQIVFDPDDAERRAASGDDVILVRRETSADDFHGMVAARAIVTQRGGMTSHAAVVARGMGKCCVTGCKDMEVHLKDRKVVVGGVEFREGDWITVDGSTGRVLRGKLPLVRPTLGEDFQRLMNWSDQFRRMGIRTNADNGPDAARAREFGAEGIGLCRTEHMFFEDDRIVAMREMILARGHDGRRKALDKLLPMQRQDFTDIFRAMDGLPVTIRLLDPPLHEFLPHDEAEIVALSESMSIDQVEVRRLVEQMRESNPMLGHRGCRLGMTHPEVTEMQARAIFEAACDATDDGIEIHAEVMVPLVATAEEMKRQADLIHRTAEMVFDERGTRFDYKVGTMIELPRAAINADLIAEHAEFFSFGTNDLTQTTFGLSRDDSGMFLPKYVEDGVIPHDPFQSIDARGVGRLIDLGVRLGRQTRNDLKVGICGEHGGDPRSIALCELIGLDYVSCSPFRVPIARLAAAHAHIKANLGTLNGDNWRLMISPEAYSLVGETES